MTSGDQPFISFYTATYRRPKQLAACLASVQAQTVANRIEQIVIPDHVGVGVGGMFSKVPQYRDAVHGLYVHLLCDDDVLASPTVVEDVERFARLNNYPPLILVATNKGGAEWPLGNPWPPRCGYIDLNCFIVRADVWKAHAESYGNTYEGDYRFGQALYDAGIPPMWCDLLFSTGAVSRGAAEAA